VARSVALVCGFLGDPPRVAWSESALPDSVLVDAPALEACIQNVLLAAVCLGAWLPTHRPVRLRVAAQAQQAPAPPPPPPPRADSVELHISALPSPPAGSIIDDDASVVASPRVTAAHPHTFTLLMTADTPGRPLSRDEIERMLAPCGMVPADKGGGTGLALYIARGIARSLGGELEVESDREEGTHIALRIPLATAHVGALAPAAPPAPPPAEAAAAEEEEEAAPCHNCSTTPCLHGVDELALTTRMFTSLLTNSADVFAICRIVTPDDGGGGGCGGATPPALRALVTYVSPAASRGAAFCMQLRVGQALHEVCVPEERRAFDAAVERAYRGSSGGGDNSLSADAAEAVAARHLLFFVHRCVTPSGGSAWCHTSGVCEGEQLLLVCRDVRARKSVELALRAFTLATTHDVRECCNAVLVAAARLERRPCAAALAPPSCTTATATAPPPSSSSTAAACAAPLDAPFLVACIRAACGLILGIVGNALTAPEVERGALTLTRDTFSPRALVADVLQACRLGHAAAAAPGGSIMLEEEGQEREVNDADVDDDAEARDADAVMLPTSSLVEADRNRIAQVTQNLVTNACKFSAGTPVCVRLTLTQTQQQQQQQQHWLAVRVRDGGRGMSAAEAAACFDAGAAAPAAAGGGTGLGLYLSRAFAALMGGTLAVDTRPAKGCTFTLRVPVRVLDARQAAVVRAAAACSAAALALAERELEEAEGDTTATVTPAQHSDSGGGGAGAHARRGSGLLKRELGGRRFHVLVAAGTHACRAKFSCIFSCMCAGAD
jgi:signal transduction histidine kinase